MELVAHRAGNDPARAALVADQADMLEVDIHLRGGRLEVRHAKQAWPTSRLWERWYLLPRETRVPELGEILAAVGPTKALMLDLKGVSPRLPGLVLAAIGDRPNVIIATKSWWLLAPFGRLAGVRRLRSAGNRFELFLLRWLPTGAKIEGVTVHRRLLDRELVEALRRRHGAVFTWNVLDRGMADDLASWGVDGLILDDLELLAGIRAAGAG